MDEHIIISHTQTVHLLAKVTFLTGTLGTCRVSPGFSYSNLSNRIPSYKSHPTIWVPVVLVWMDGIIEEDISL